MNKCRRVFGLPLDVAYTQLTARGGLTNDKLPTMVASGESMNDARRRLLWHGMFLFLLGLVTGFAEQSFSNPRMGLAAHLEGVMNGTFLIALGAIWPEVRLSSKLKAAAFWSALYGTYANWVITTLAAILGTAAMSPITANGHNAQPLQEAVVFVGFLTVGIVVVLSSILVLWGLRHPKPV